MKVLLTFLFYCTIYTGYSQTEVFRKKQFNLDDGVAIKGYDPVAYFTAGKAEKGKVRKGALMDDLTKYIDEKSARDPILRAEYEAEAALLVLIRARQAANMTQ